VLQQAGNTVWAGVKGDRALKIAAKADGWNAAWFQDPDAYAERSARVPKSVRRSIGQYARGSAREMVDRLHAFAALGVEHTVMCFGRFPFGLDDPDDLSRFAQDVIPYKP
jgi:alkanesulfonate monooxygenase SsuD/methylene tetrahydromethanopterin reductase-like flavin-dependent oxidoreductase (luciferase family)